MLKRWVGLLMGVLLLAACGPLGQPSAAEIVRRAETAMEALEQAHAIVEVEATMQGETTRVVGEGWMDGERTRGTILESSQPEMIGALAVSDGSTGWLYHPEHDKVLTGDIATLKAYKEEHAEESSPEMDFSGLTEVVDELLRMTNQELVGSETIAGFDSWHLRLTPNGEAPREWVAAGGVADLWISKAHDLPLQLTYTGGSLGEGRVTVREFDPSPTFAADLFTFTPPAGVEAIDVATLLPEQMSLPEAREAAGFALLSTPQDSAEAALLSVVRVQESYVQEFEGSLGSWTLAQSQAKAEVHGRESNRGEGHEEMGEVERVDLRGTKARLHSDSERGWTLLTWEENGAIIVLSGKLSPEAALQLAEGLE